MGSRRTVVLGLTLLLLAAGCAGKQRQERLYDWAAEHVYARPAEQLYVDVQGFFAKKRVGFKPTKGKDRYVILSDWQESFSGSRVSGNAWRYYVEVRPLGPVSASVHVYRHTVFTGGKDRTRSGQSEAFRTGIKADVDEMNVNSRFNEVKSSRLTRFNRDRKLEWELLEMLSPEDAAEQEARLPR